MAPKSKSKSSKALRDAAPVTTDSRFSIIHSDPRFAPPKRKDTSITLDSRFKGVLKDPRFSSAARVDRYGRKLPKENARAELQRYYRLEEEEAEEEEEGKARFDPARGEGVVDTDDSSSSESGEEEEEDVEVTMDEGVEEAAGTDIPEGEVTRRFAAVNLDWDNVRAVDLMKAFSSFAPSGGKVTKVTVYPSEFGRQRMEREEIEGPPRELFRKDKDVEDEDEEEEVSEKTIVKEDKGEEFDSAKLRQYQLERLRYYYAVVECDSERTAKHIYDNCDGAEYEATANFFDLRFIPDETTFDEDKPRDECVEAPNEYTPNEFVTDALQHSKVKLMWDEDDQQRKQVAKKAFSQREVEENELKAYLASSDSESDGDDKESKKEKYRALLGGLTFGGKTKGEPTGEMEVTFTSGLEGEDKDGKVLDLEETALEKYVRKEKERKKARKEKLKAKKATETGGAPAQNETVAEPEEADQAAVDLGFDDPFFDKPAQSNDALRKAERKKKREQKAAEAAEKASKRAELELLMEDDDQILGQDGKKLSHFDMKQVVKAEKLKKVKKPKHKKGLEQAEGLQDDFEMDVKDPRFGAVFERHEFAIDPTNPRFIKTENTKKLMEEKRKRTATKAGVDRNGAPDEEDGRQKKRKKSGQERGKRDELQKLVQSLKKKSAAKA